MSQQLHARGSTARGLVNGGHGSGTTTTTMNGSSTSSQSSVPNHHHHHGRYNYNDTTTATSSNGHHHHHLSNNNTNGVHTVHTNGTSSSSSTILSTSNHHNHHPVSHQPQQQHHHIVQRNTIQPRRKRQLRNSRKGMNNGWRRYISTILLPESPPGTNPILRWLHALLLLLCGCMILCLIGIYHHRYYSSSSTNQYYNNGRHHRSRAVVGVGDTMRRDKLIAQRWKDNKDWKLQRQQREFDAIAPHGAGQIIQRQQTNDKAPYWLKEFDKVRQSREDILTSSNNNNNNQNENNIMTLDTQIHEILLQWLEEEDNDIRHNIQINTTRWIRPYLLPPIPGSKEKPLSSYWTAPRKRQKRRQIMMRGGGGDSGEGTSNRLMTPAERSDFFKVSRTKDIAELSMTWQTEYQTLLSRYQAPPIRAADAADDDEDDAESNSGSNHNKKRRSILPGPRFDYTDSKHYIYPDRIETPPNDGSYPQLQTLEELMTNWPQDEDYDASTSRNHDNDKNGGRKIYETLQHFNYSDPEQRHMASLYRDAELPFKLYNVPDIDAATPKWKHDEYISSMFGEISPYNAQFGGGRTTIKHPNGTTETLPLARGNAQESRTNYFAFYVAKSWELESMGLAPTRNNDWNYHTWAQHAVYADAVSLSAQKPHYYWQAGVPPEERHLPPHKWTFISRDLPSLSSPTENFFVFHVQEQKGIQCRFGERGIVAATHFDGGRNMVAMIVGAKRYILSPPQQCSKLGIFTDKRSPIYRHSLLNFGHIPYLRNTTMSAGMSEEERVWLERAASSKALETVLKQGEVLYIPSHWFHYIVSLQKSAQCNVRSGIDQEGNVQFGGRKDVEECMDPE